MSLWTRAQPGGCGGVWGVKILHPADPSGETSVLLCHGNTDTVVISCPGHAGQASGVETTLCATSDVCHEGQGRGSCVVKSQLTCG